MNSILADTVIGFTYASFLFIWGVGAWAIIRRLRGE